MTELAALHQRQAAKRQNIIEITARYYRQVRYGCENPACQTPGCLTFERKRSTSAPYRVPTALSARAIAACLASTAHPEANLCPHGQLLPQNDWDQAFPLLSGDEPVDPVDSDETAQSSSSAPKEIDEKSLSQLLFNSRSWKSARTSDPAGIPGRLIESVDILGLESRLSIEGTDSTFLCAGLDALCDFLPQFSDDGEHGKESIPRIWPAWTELRRHGRYLLDPATRRKAGNRVLAQACMAMADSYQDENALRLLRHVLRAFMARVHATHESEARESAVAEILGFLTADPGADILEFPAPVYVPTWHGGNANRLASTAAVVLEWCRVALQHEWNNKPTFSWASTVGGAIAFLDFLYQHRQQLGLDKKTFETPFLFKRMDFMDVPRCWLEDALPKNSDHLLNFPWLFPVSNRVTYFRAINHMSMSKAVNASLSLQYLITRLRPLVESHDEQIFEKLRIAMGQLLVLEISRGAILEDAMNQLWRRQKRELRRPLKVRMGMDEGEEGVDFGGVQQEFFRLSLGEALDPNYGLFTTDETTRMTWFLPCSRAPLHQFVLVGILVGLAVYNGITLSVTFPEALYRKLLGQPVSLLEHIADGWPTLTKGLQYLLDYSDGDVADVLMRSYVFSTETDGMTVSADMQKHTREMPWPSESEPQDSEVVEANAQLVTNLNREQYVQDYIFWLTDKSIRPHYEAFAAGFYMCVDRTALRLFDAPALQNLVEGYQRIDIDALQRTASYDNGYHPGHPVIQNFWHVVRNFNEVEVRKLLEFVTASDRVPAKGIEEIVFIMQRNGRDDDRLPTSQTCFGRLLLPEYSTKEILEAKLRQAMVHSLGFYLQ